jgi:hypothetical protein
MIDWLIDWLIDWSIDWLIVVKRPLEIQCHAHIICITVLENRIIWCQIFSDLLLKSAFERMLMLCSWFWWPLAKINWFTRHETDRFLNNHCRKCVRAYLSIHDCLSFHHEVMNGNHRNKVILHQLWVKKRFPWKFNLEYGGTFTKLFMHVSCQNMFPTTRNLFTFHDQ